ncbi:hypothetical protein KSP40_PGU004047 [Platanthera guangdongensis]|uniref:RRM domain-containing protein n=1 Tax=Platanthera guangdongensis TaxID=2320717 RepID=A0ABR2MAT5_9ASPA
MLVRKEVGVVWYWTSGSCGCRLRSDETLNDVRAGRDTRWLGSAAGTPGRDVGGNIRHPFPLAVVEDPCLDGWSGRRKETPSRVACWSLESAAVRGFGCVAVAAIGKTSKACALGMTKERLAGDDKGRKIMDAGGIRSISASRSSLALRRYSMERRLANISVCQSRRAETKMAVEDMVFAEGSGKSKGFGFVLFSQESEAATALQKMDGQYFAEEKRIRFLEDKSQQGRRPLGRHTFLEGHKSGGEKPQDLPVKSSTPKDLDPFRHQILSEEASRHKSTEKSVELGGGGSEEETGDDDDDDQEDSDNELDAELEGLKADSMSAKTVISPSPAAHTSLRKRGRREDELEEAELKKKSLALIHIPENASAIATLQKGLKDAVTRITHLEEGIEVMKQNAARDTAQASLSEIHATTLRSTPPEDAVQKYAWKVREDIRAIHAPIAKLNKYHGGASSVLAEITDNLTFVGVKRVSGEDTFKE